MFQVDPFAAVAAFLPSGFMKVFLATMIAAVVLGTIYEMCHRGSARYFFAQWSECLGGERQGMRAREILSLVLRVALVDVMASGGFCNRQRRTAHLLTMHGFLLYLVSTLTMVFSGPSHGIVPTLWWLGGLLVCVGAAWFWFFIRVDVVAEGCSRLRVVRADLFVLALVTSVVLGLVWAGAGGYVNAWFWSYLLANVVLFGTVPWSKFPHMFFKPAVALHQRLAVARGMRSGLPESSAKPPQYGTAVKHNRHY